MEIDFNSIVVHIPARKGSQRVPLKNIRKINGQPMIAYTIKAALNSKYISKVYLNTDSDEFAKIGEKYGATPYMRNEKLASNIASSEDFNYDIIKQLSPQTLLMINPVCPLIQSIDIDEAIEAFNNSDCDTLITSSATRMQVFCEDKPINISTQTALRPSQENPEVHTLNWAITIWNTQAFCKRFEELGHASLGKNRLLHKIDAYKSIKVSYEEDFELVKKLLN